MTMDDDTPTIDDVRAEQESHTGTDNLELRDLQNAGAIASTADTSEDNYEEKQAHDLEAIFDVPVKLTAVLGRSRMEISDILKLGAGSIIELNRQVGEAIDIYINNRLIARGEVVLVEKKLGITVTEIIRNETS